MEKLIQQIRYYIGMNPEATPSDIIQEISNIINGDVYPGESKSIYAQMVDKVFTAICFKDPQGNEHWTHKLL